MSLPEDFKKWEEDAREKKGKEIQRAVRAYEDALTYAANNDFKSAYEACREVLEPIDEETQYNWGVAYYNGMGIAQNYEKAYYYFKIAADKGYASAQRALGGMYLFGQYVAKDITSAIEYFSKAAEAKDGNAALNLAIIYYNGKETSQNYKEAYRWLKDFEDTKYCKYKIDIDRDGYLANAILGDLYLRGKGTEQDFANAKKCFDYAANHNNEDAQYWLAIMYLSGTGVQKDSVIGEEWLKKAAENGYEDAKKLLSSEDRDAEIAKIVTEEIFSC